MMKLSYFFCVLIISLAFVEADYDVQQIQFSFWLLDL